MIELEVLYLDIRTIEKQIDFLIRDIAHSKNELKLFKKRLQEKLEKLKRLEDENSSSK